MEERRTHNPLVVGSIPTMPKKVVVTSKPQVLGNAERGGILMRVILVRDWEQPTTAFIIILLNSNIIALISLTKTLPFTMCVAMRHSRSIIDAARKMRKETNASIDLLSKKFNASRTTVYYWVKDITLKKPDKKVPPPRVYKHTIGDAAPFVGYRIYPPRFDKHIQRQTVHWVDPLTNKLGGMSYARYLMCIHLGRFLLKSEEVDHKNNNRLDDRIENLQVLTPKENKEKHTREVILGELFVELMCPTCGKKFERPKRNSYIVKGGDKTHCSRTCGNTKVKKYLGNAYIREFRK